MNKFTYTKEKTKEISFPLGGIGTGCIGLSGNGRLIDWEIFNKPNKGSINGFSHFAIKAESDGELLDARVLNGDLEPPYTGDLNRGHFQSYGFGPHRATLAGVPHFRDTEFKGEYPLAELNFIEDKFPGSVKMKAFNPFIPINDKDSSIPAAFFEIEVENTTKQDITYTIALSANNPLSEGINSYNFKNGIHTIKLNSEKNDENQTDNGDLTIATDNSEVSFQEYWYRGVWFDNLGIYWRDFTENNKFKNRSYTSPGNNDICTLAAHIEVKPQTKKKVKFIISWSFPEMKNYWNIPQCDCEDDNCCDKEQELWKNYYATVFDNSVESAVYSFEKWKELYKQTLKFKDALFSSTLPEIAIEAISANISILKTPTCLRLEDGSFYGFEGCQCDSGCCEGSCTHVWNYAYALPFLFPELERSMRDLDFKFNQREDGGMAFRLQLPIGREKSKFRPCADGQFGGVIKAYRDWKISGDNQWLKSNWEAIKKSIEFAWAKTNQDKWDSNKEGVLEGRQHHTLDMELFGPNSWLTGFYLAALKAGAEMAEFLGESDTASEYRKLFRQGKKWVDENLFNGDYYHQLIDIKDKSIIEQFEADKYWNEEAGEIKYQVTQGCGIDQVVAQWHANICGLGEIFAPEQTKKALESVYKYNYKKSMRDFFNPCRLYSLNDEAGLVICDWPEGIYKPVVPLTYAEETMNGFEYQAAIHMIQEGLVKEGMEIVVAIRERYDGEKRNPWNEFECGSNYARSMASYALLTTFSGFQFDLVKGMIGFDPINITDKYSCFWSVNSAWGVFSKKNKQIELKVLYGQLELKILSLPFLTGKEIKDIKVNDDMIKFNFKEGKIILSEPVEITEGNTLLVFS